MITSVKQTSITLLQKPSNPIPASSPETFQEQPLSEIAPIVMMRVGEIVSLVGVGLGVVTFAPIIAVTSLLLAGVMHYGGNEFEQTKKLNAILVSLRESNASFQKSIKTLDSRVHSIAKENGHFSKSNEQLKKTNQELSDLINHVKEETIKLNSLREAHGALLENNQLLNEELETTAHKLDVLRSILCDEVIKLQGSSTSIKGETIALKGIKQRLGNKVKHTLQAKQTGKKTKKPPLSKRKLSHIPK